MLSGREVSYHFSSDKDLIPSDGIACFTYSLDSLLSSNISVCTIAQHPAQLALIYIRPQSTLKEMTDLW